MKDFLTFKKMVTPLLVQILFWIAIVVDVITGIVMVATGELGTDIASGILVIVLGPLLIRIYAELAIVLFRINESLWDIRTNTTQA